MASQNFNLMQRGVHTLQIIEGGETLSLNASLVEELVEFLRVKNVFDNDAVVVAYTAPQTLTTIPAA